MTELEATLLAVREQDSIGYGGRALPCELDSSISALLNAFIAATPLERQRLGLQVDDTLSRLLIVFAERMASLAVRLVSRANLFLGLVALAAEGWKADPRDDLTVLSLLHDAAVRIGSDPRENFQEVVPYTTKAIADALERFLTRSAQDKSIEAMGYRAGVRIDGFRYERTW